MPDKEIVPEKKEFSLSLETLLMLPAPETIAIQQECEEAEECEDLKQKTCQPSPVPLRKTRRVLFEPSAAKRQEEVEGKIGS